jgi:hypothetical protein
MTKHLKEMTEQETMLFSLYADLEYALVQEYEHMDVENISSHLRKTVGWWSSQLHDLGLLGDHDYDQAQKMADGDDSWVNS